MAELFHNEAKDPLHLKSDWKSRYPEPAKPDLVGMPPTPERWCWASADQLTDANHPITYGVIKLGPKVSEGVPVLRSSNVRTLKLELDGVKRISRKIADEYQRTYLNGGEVLVTVRGTLGGVVSVPEGCAGYNISREVAVLSLLKPQSSQSVAYLIASDLLQNWLKKRAKGIAYTGINIETLREMPIPLSSSEEQTELTRQVERRLKASLQLEATIKQQIDRVHTTRQSLLREAFTGRLVGQNKEDEPASHLLQRIRTSHEANAESEKKAKASRETSRTQKENRTVNRVIPTVATLQSAWQEIGETPDAKQLFEVAGFTSEQVLEFYDLLRAAPEIRQSFEATSKSKLRTDKTPSADSVAEQPTQGSFRLVTLWLENFKNLTNYEASFDPGYGLDVVLGWNGTGKSNLFEALVIIFRDLHQWREKNRWPDEPMAGYRLVYTIEEHLVEVTWNPAQMRRPEVKRAVLGKDGTHAEFQAVKREDVPLPWFVFGYYSGPTNRLAEHFLPMKRDHYERLVKAKSDDPATLASLLKQRRFFCAETHHAKYVLLAFSYKEDPKITYFLEHRLRILGFESALFVIRKPRWARKGSTAKDFWGAAGIMLRVIEKLRDYAIAPMIVEQLVSDGYRTRKEDHYFFFLPDLKSLHAFASEYADAQSFFMALESTDFSELIHDVRIQVRIKSVNGEEVPITFHQLSEGEQQLLMVLGLMRFTKSHQSLVLLDEPDTHLNPHWSVDYLKDLASVCSDDDRLSPEQQTSQMLMATHDPLVIASLLKDQVHLLKRNRNSLQCYWEEASEDPRGLGYTGILISDMFGFRSDLDEETLALLDRQVRLAGKSDPLSGPEKAELTALNKQIESLGFKSAISDPYYRAFIEALNHRQDTLALLQKPFQTPEERKEIREVAGEILTQLAQKHSLQS